MMVPKAGGKGSVIWPGVGWGARLLKRRWVPGWIFQKWTWAVLLVVMLVAVAGCRRRSAAPVPPPVPAGAFQVGIASWYGHPFHGRRTANGEVYNMEAPTAAHKTLPFDTFVEVRNLQNGKRTVVRINDRGPFVKGRIIDLSRSAARKIDMIGPGTARVRLSVIDRPRGQPPGRQYTVQVGAFRRKDYAERLTRKLREKYENVFLIRVEASDRTFYRVRVGREPSLERARHLAEQLKKEREIEAAIVLGIE